MRIYEKKTLGYIFDKPIVGSLEWLGGNAYLLTISCENEQRGYMLYVLQQLKKQDFEKELTRIIRNRVVDFVWNCIKLEKEENNEQ